MNGIVAEKKKHLIAPLLVSVLLLVLSIMTRMQAGSEEPWQLPAAIAASIFAGVLLYVPFSWKPLRAIWNLIVTLGTPVAAVFLVQNLNDDFSHGMLHKPMLTNMLIVNIVLYVLIYFFFAFLLGSVKWGYLIPNIAFLLIGVADYFVVMFRSSPIVPWDLFSLGTATSVAGNYSYELSWRLTFSVIGFFYLGVAGCKVSLKMHHLIIRLLLCVLLAGTFVYGVKELNKDEVKEWLQMDTTLFTPNVRYRNNGFLAAFLGNLHLIDVEKPEGYSVEKVEEMKAQIEADTSVPANVSASDTASSSLNETAAAAYKAGQTPNIVVVIDEAFSDLSTRGDFGVSEDPIPFFRQMQQENVGGQLLVSVKGGNTANTEYEFLSGDTMGFLPAGSVVFQQFIHDQVPALPSYLASLGYETIGIHPYLKSGWNRETVFPLLGFQKFLSKDDFADPVKVREYISDQSAFDKVIEQFENSQTDKPKFVYLMTMQNHSGYSKDYPGFTEEIKLTDISYENIQTRATEKYLTLTKYTDNALKDMMAYFNTFDEPTIVVMFGDHQPSDYVTTVIDQLTGYNPDSEDIEEAKQSYKVPYFVWNNFGMNMEDRELSSVNYLAADILDAAGIPLTDYQKFLLKMQEQIPAIAAGAYVDNNGTYHSLDEETDLSDLLNQYNILAYNHLTDFKNRVTDLFAKSANAN